MKKKTIFISIGIIFIIIATTITIIAIKKKKPNLDYQLEVVKEINYMLYMENNKYGVISKNGDILVEAKYDEIQIPNPSKPLFICKYDYNNEKNQYKIKVLNDKSEQILYQYVTVEAIELNSGSSQIPYEKSVLKYAENNKYGLINFNGDVITKPQYDEISSFDYNEGLLLVKKNGRYGVININGVNFVKEEYDVIESDGYYQDDNVQYRKSGFIVGMNKENKMKYGYINRNAEKILDVKFDQIDRIDNPDNGDDAYLVTFENDKAGFYKNKECVLPNEFEDIAYDKNNRCLIIQKDSKQGICDLEGNIQIELKYDNIYISGKYINAQNGNSIDIFDYYTKSKIEYDGIVGVNQTTTNNYSIAITDDEKYKIIDNEKNELKDRKYEYLEYIYEDYFVVYKNKKFGIINSKGEIIVDYKYDSIQKVQNANMVIAINSKKNLTEILKDGNVVASMLNSEIMYKDKYIIMFSSKERIYIDFDGNVIDNKKIFDSQLYANEKNGKWGFVDKNGEVIVDYIYDYATELNINGFAGIKQNGKWGVINSSGEIIVQPTYEIKTDNPNFVGKFYEINKGYGYNYFVSE